VDKKLYGQNKKKTIHKTGSKENCTWGNLRIEGQERDSGGRAKALQGGGVNLAERCYKGSIDWAER